MLMNWAKYTVSPTRRLSKGADTSPQLNKQFTESQQYLVRRRLGIWYTRIRSMAMVCSRNSTCAQKYKHGNSTIILWKLGKAGQLSELIEKENNLILHILALMYNKV